ncbi:isoamyl acetate-hydrolyzing esterase 1 homolog isoform X1 [Neomonachus schauinslandi]|uniref:1-alkyl-2-acetylglycerophosphocholine esterase n=1 Tax=Neomonachus schauinslandi TaxID=29088 RepID=A0A2Y9HP07_NEOSC|nr:isoamyl acetate-hydrolyzing esterase 1 homolog isoform X1 [Neomonachus schauinslandi]
MWVEARWRTADGSAARFLSPGLRGRSREDRPGRFRLGAGGGEEAARPAHDSCGERASAAPPGSALLGLNPSELHSSAGASPHIQIRGSRPGVPLPSLWVRWLPPASPASALPFRVPCGDQPLSPRPHGPVPGSAAHGDHRPPAGSGGPCLCTKHGRPRASCHPRALSTGCKLNRLNSVVGEYAGACLQVAQDCGIDVLDLWTLMQKDSQDFSSYLSDGLHLSPKGNEFLFSHLWPLIEKKVSSLPLLLPYWRDVAEAKPELSLLGDGDR